MMGNFLTTLGVEPAEDREMFEDLGLNVARQPDNGANPRPDNRSGWLEGETPEKTPMDELIDTQAEANFWDPSTQLRVIKKKGKVPEYPKPSTRRLSPRAGATSARLSESGWRSCAQAASIAGCALVESPQGAQVMLDGEPVILLCSNNYLGLADHARVRCAASDAAMQWGASAGASRLVSGSMPLHAELERRWPSSRASHRRSCSGRATSPTPA